MIDTRIAAITCQCPVGEIAANLDRTLCWSRQAMQAGADLVCFPELNITGYANCEEMRGFAQQIPGPLTQRLSAGAAETGLIILAGMAERNGHAAPYATHCVFWPDGRIGIYRKVHLAPPERPYFSAGDTIPVFDGGRIRFGIQLCYDAHFPELAIAMALQGAELLLLPHASPRGDAAAKHESWMRHLPARAFDNSLFVAACNQRGPNGRGLSFAGNAVVIGPSGIVQNDNTVKKEEMLVTDLKAADLAGVRDHPMRYFFPNRRPDLY